MLKTGFFRASVKKTYLTLLGLTAVSVNKIKGFVPEKNRFREAVKNPFFCQIGPMSALCCDKWGRLPGFRFHPRSRLPRGGQRSARPARTSVCPGGYRSVTLGNGNGWAAQSLSKQKRPKRRKTVALQDAPRGSAGVRQRGCCLADDGPLLLSLCSMPLAFSLIQGQKIKVAQVESRHFEAFLFHVLLQTASILDRNSWSNINQ